MLIELEFVVKGRGTLTAAKAFDLLVDVFDVPFQVTERLPADDAEVQGF